jgi:uncharacterized membrane protein
MHPPIDSHPPTDPDRYLRAGVYYSLIAGMTLSTFLCAAGVALALAHTRHTPLALESVRPYYHAGYLVHALATLDATAVLMLATVALILTPVTRVVASVVAFAAGRDYKFALLTTLVVLEIVATVVLGFCGILS